MLEERDINYEFYNFFRRKNIFNFISNKLFDYNNNDIFNGRYTKFYIVITVGVLSIFMLGYLLSEYFRQKKKAKKIISLVDNVNEKYLISEIIKEPLEMENKAYYYALKQACKSMNDRIGELEKENAEYQEYVESFVHEIKTLYQHYHFALENNNDFRLKQEVDKINQLVEQMLYLCKK